MSIESIRKSILELMTVHPDIHINLSLTNPKITLKNESVTIKAVYPYVFLVEEKNCGVLRSFTFQYSDILTGRIEISELKKSSRDM